MNKLLARILLVLALLAPAIAYTPSHDGHAATPQQDMVLFSGKVVPRRVGGLHEALRAHDPIVAHAFPHLGRDAMGQHGDADLRAE